MVYRVWVVRRGEGYDVGSLMCGLGIRRFFCLCFCWKVGLINGNLEFFGG